MRTTTWLGVASAIVLAFVSACSGDDDGASNAGGSAAFGGKGATGGAGGTPSGGSAGLAPIGGAPSGGSSADGGSSGSGATAGGGSCLAGSMLSALGKSKLLVGAAMSDEIAQSAPFDLRYQYVAGGIADGAGPCASCASGCTTNGTSCANSGPGCAWWGCWQYDQDPPGAFVRGFVSKVEADGQIPIITYYIILQASGVGEGEPEVTQANDAAFMARYFADWTFLAKQIGSHAALLHIEPDFWGYAQHVDSDPTKIPAAVASADASDCGAFPNTIAGMGSCMIAIGKKYAPNAKVSLHGSGWATKFDVLLNSDPSFDVAGHAQQLGQFLLAAGPDADFITVDAADRDAAWYDTQGQDRWWDATNATLPSFTQAFTWSKNLAEAAQKSILWWQLPVGNMSQSNTTLHWQDNRVDYFMTHMNEVALAHGFGVAFGAGASGQTTPSTDGGNLVSKVQSYASAGGQTPCP